MPGTYRRWASRVRGLPAVVQAVYRDYSRTSHDHRQLDQQRLDATWKVLSFSAWVSFVAVEPRTSISVIVATRNRGQLLSRAVASVLGQTYSNFQLVVVNDGSTDHTSEYLAGLGDSRVVTARTCGEGLAVARNRGLALATGQLVAYLDDDNVMHPEWLKSVAWAFAQFPHTNLLYGARLVEDFTAVAHAGEAPLGDYQLPVLDFIAFDAARLRAQNYIDVNAVAHRRDHRESYFDTRTSAASDWDLVLRFAQTSAPLALPSLACAYHTRDPGRLLRAPDAGEDMNRVRSMHGL